MTHKLSLIPKKPSEELLKKSRHRLDAMFKDRFKSLQTARKEQRSIDRRTFGALRNVVKHDPELAEAVKAAKDLASLHVKQDHRAVDRRKARVKLEQAVSLGSPFWPWQWSETTGPDANVAINVDPNAGTMSFLGDTGDNGKTISCAVALGDYFQPADDGLPPDLLRPMFLSAVMPVSYYMNTWTVFDSAHAGGVIGFYVGEYTLDGEFVQAVVDQKNDLSSIANSDQGSNSAYSPVAVALVDLNHFYEVWVWAGGDAEADGWSALWGSAAMSSANITVPSIQASVI